MPSSPTTRRQFIQSSIATGAVIAGGAIPSVFRRSARGREQTSPKKLRILILGGTQFIGPAFVELARARGHSISVFNRGITEKRKGSLGDDIERLVGDRDPDKGNGLKSLEGKNWDAVLDNSGFYPRHVKASAELLAAAPQNARQYIFVSSISAYASNDKANQDETAPLATLADPNVETMGDEFQNYGGLKVLCEQAAEKAMPGRTAIVRPGFIVGPGDPSDRFTYWPVRVERGGEMLAPGTPNDGIQVIDVRDLAAFLLHLAETNTVGTFNACGTPGELTMGKLLEESKRACGTSSPGSKTELTWVSAEFLEGFPDVNLPIWIPAKGEALGFHTWSNARAVTAGLTFRPIGDTIKDTLAWFPKEVERRARVTKEAMDESVSKGEEPPEMGDPTALRAGPNPEQEARVLKAWHEKIGD